MPQFHKSCTLTVALGAQTYRAEFHGDNMFDNAIAKLKDKVITHYVRGTIEKLEVALGELMLVLGDYAVELLRSAMVPYGDPSGSVHVVTGSLLYSIEDQSTGNINRGPVSERGHAGSLTSTLIAGINPDEVRYEHSAAFSSGADESILRGTRQYNREENVSEYGKRYFETLQEQSDFVSYINDALYEIVKARAAWEWLHKTARLSHLRNEIWRLRSENMQKVEAAARARLAEKQR